MTSQTNYHWIIALSDLQAATGLDSKEEIAKRLGLVKPFWDEPEIYAEVDTGVGGHVIIQPEVEAAQRYGDATGEHLVLFEQPLLNWETLDPKHVGSTFATRRYCPNYEDHPAIKKMWEAGIEVQTPEIQDDPEEGEEFTGFILRTQNEALLEERALRKLCQAINLRIPKGKSACRAFFEDDSALAKANDYCKTEFGCILSTELTECCDITSDDEDTKESDQGGIYFNRSSLSPLVGIDQQIKFSELGLTILQLGVTPIRTTRAFLAQ